MEIVKISITLIILSLIAKYIEYIMTLCGLILPPIMYKFLLFGIAISIIQYIIERKDD